MGELAFDFVIQYFYNIFQENYVEILGWISLNALF